MTAQRLFDVRKPRFQIIRYAGWIDVFAGGRSAEDPLTAELMDAMLEARAALWRQYLKLHAMVLRLVAGDEVCRRLMEIPGVGPITALTFVTAIDDPARFRRSRDVGAYFGLTSKRWQSGASIDIQGRISKAGDAELCSAPRGILGETKQSFNFKANFLGKFRPKRAPSHCPWNQGPNGLSKIKARCSAFIGRQLPRHSITAFAQIRTVDL